MARNLLVANLLVAGFLLGCSKPPEPSASEVPELELSIPGETSDATPEPSTDSQAFEAPDRVVELFLAAVREGDEAATALLLTDKAREETAKHNLVVRPPGTPSATFEVGDLQYIDTNRTGAHVNTIWTESTTDATGASHDVTYDVVWALRRQVDGWRVAGIATEIIEGQAPVFLNFEDPGDMLDKWKRAEEIAARHEDAVHHAQAPSAGGNSLRR